MIRSIRKRSEFDRLRNDGRRCRQGCLRITFLDTTSDTPAGDDEAQLAFAIGRKFGNAVERNRARRRLRAVFAQLDREGALRGGIYLVIPHRSALSIDHPTMVRDVTSCLDKVSALNPSSPRSDDLAKAQR